MELINNNPVPEGYKKTEVGVIREDWEVGSIESVVPPGKKYGIVDGPFGSNLKSIHYKTFGIPIISSGYVTEGYFLAKDYIYVDSQKFYQEKRSAVSGGDIVMAKIGARCGASAILPKDHETGILSGNALKITVDSEKHSTYFIWQLLWNLYVKGQLENITTVGAQPAVSMANLKKYKIPLPPLPEQKAIAQTLSDVDALIDALDKLIAKNRNIKTATMQQLLTGKTRLPGFGGEWENFYLCDLFEITAGGDLVKSEYSEIQTNTYPYPIYANSVINGGVYGYSSFEEYKGDCITITARGTLGFACYRHTSFVAIGRLLVLSPRLKLDAFFFAEAINHQIQFANESTSVPQLTAPQTAQYRLSIPKLEEQKAIAKILSDIDSEITALEKRRAKTQAIKQGMMQELLTGRTRLKFEHPDDPITKNSNG